MMLGAYSPVVRSIEEIFGFRLSFAIPAAVLAAVLHALPLMVKSVRGALQDLDESKALRLPETRAYGCSVKYQS